MVGDILEKKCVADRVDEAKGSSKDTMREFLDDYFETKFGVGKYSEAMRDKLVRSVEKCVRTPAPASLSNCVWFDRTADPVGPFFSPFFRTTACPVETRPRPVGSRWQNGMWDGCARYLTFDRRCEMFGRTLGIAPPHANFSNDVGDLYIALLRRASRVESC